VAGVSQGAAACQHITAASTHACMLVAQVWWALCTLLVPLVLLQPAPDMVHQHPCLRCGTVCNGSSNNEPSPLAAQQLLLSSSFALCVCLSRLSTVVEQCMATTLVGRAGYHMWLMSISSM
jgi:hypothetical protein